MKIGPRISCPYCGKKYYTYQKAIDCADNDVKENEAKKRKLIPLKT